MDKYSSGAPLKKERENFPSPRCFLNFIRKHAKCCLSMTVFLPINDDLAD